MFELHTELSRAQRDLFNRFYTRPVVGVQRGGAFNLRAWVISTYHTEREMGGEAGGSLHLEIAHDFSDEPDTARLFTWVDGEKIEVLTQDEIKQARDDAAQHGDTWDRDDVISAEVVDSTGCARRVLTETWITLNQVASFAVATQY